MTDSTRPPGQRARRRWRPIHRAAALAAVFVLVVPAAVLGFNSIGNTWAGVYPGSASRTNAGCQLCHGPGEDTLNAYGHAMQLAGTNAAGIGSIAGLNSDGDPGGFSNVDEINANAQPGWTVGNNNTLYDFNGNVALTGQARPGGHRNHRSRAHADADPGPHADADPGPHADADPGPHADADPGPHADADPGPHADADPVPPTPPRRRRPRSPRRRRPRSPRRRRPRSPRRRRPRSPRRRRPRSPRRRRPRSPRRRRPRSPRRRRPRSPRRRRPRSPRRRRPRSPRLRASRWMTPR